MLKTTRMNVSDKSLTAGAARGPSASVLGIAVAMALAYSESRAAGAPAPVEFDEGFLVNGAQADLTRFSHGNPVDAGTYRIEVVANGAPVDRRDVTFMPSSIPTQAVPCLTGDLLIAAGLQPELLQPEDASACVSLGDRVPHASAAFDVANQRLAISIPQTAIRRQVRGHVDRSLRDDGVLAAYVDYHASVQHGDGGTSGYVGTLLGANAGPWRIRQRGSVRWNRRGTSYQNMETYLQRDIARWNSQLRMGEGVTRGELFDGTTYTGIQLSSDDRMLPDSMRGYAPVVRGIARTHAKVTIRQNGYVIYETSVAPGPFAIDELYPTNYGGDLRVVVTEADGSEQHFSMDFASVPQALREGVTRYSATAGKLRGMGGRADADDFFGELTWARGTSNRLTLIGGAQISDGYTSVLAGAAISTGIGAVGVDVTMAQANLPNDGAQRGASMRLNYQRHLAQTGTNFGFAAYRYSTSGYLTLSEASRRRTHPDINGGWERAKHRLQISASQRLGQQGSLYARGGLTRYWGRSQAQTDFEIGVQRRFGRVSYALSAMRNANESGRRQDSVQLTISVPLDGVGWANSLNSTLQSDSRGGSGRASVGGNFGSNGTKSYNVGLSADADGDYDVYGGVQADTRAGRVDAAASVSSARRTISAGASGSIVAHSGGVNFGASINDSFALIHAPGAEGARVGSGARRVAGNGYALMSNVTPYRWNNIEIDPRGLSLDVELMQTTQRVVPSAGAAVKVKFQTRVDDSLFLRLAPVVGETPVAFGSEVRDADRNVVGVVGQGGVVHLRGEIKEPLSARMEGSGECTIRLTGPIQPNALQMRWALAQCVVSAVQESAQPNETSSTRSLMPQQR